MESFKDCGIVYLHYMTHIDNAPSILKHGILSYNQVIQKGLLRIDVSDANVQYRRAATRLPNNKTVHDYVPLYFAVQTPMQYVITVPASTRNRDQVLRNNDLIFIDIDPSRVFEQNGVVFSDGNAASNETKFYTSVKDLTNLDWDVLRGPGTYEGTNGQCYKSEWKRHRSSVVRPTLLYI